LEEKFPIILAEWEKLKKSVLVAWPEKYLCKKGWDVLGLYAFQNKFEKNCNLCPVTTSILEKIPGMCTSMFSCLSPRSHIKPHVGYSAYSEHILRCHLALIVPDGCALRANGKKYVWKPGKCMVFDDTYTHEVFFFFYFLALFYGCNF